MYILDTKKGCALNKQSVDMQSVNFTPCKKGDFDQMEPKLKGKFVTVSKNKFFKILSVKKIGNNR